jgi:hypothetical protein
MEFLSRRTNDSSTTNTTLEGSGRANAGHSEKVIHVWAWEGEAPAELGFSGELRLGGSLALPLMAAWGRERSLQTTALAEVRYGEKIAARRIHGIEETH